ncbi:hypothetical protein ACFL59_07025 [Planctomycetota bacterium]
MAQEPLAATAPLVRAAQVSLLAALLLVAVGCTSTQTTTREKPRSYKDTGKVLFVGAFYDLRNALPGTLVTDGGSSTEDRRRETVSVDPRGIRTPVGEIRSLLAHTVARCGLFQRVANPPLPFAGSTADEMIQKAQRSSDYLLVGEVNQFYIRSLGFNSRGAVALSLDLVFAPVAFVTYLTTMGKTAMFSGVLIAGWSAEAVLSVSVSLIDVGTGMVVDTIRLEERALSPYDALDAYGSLWNDADDWVDLGRRLGDVALHNAGIHLTERLHVTLQQLGKTRR